MRYSINDWVKYRTVDGAEVVGTIVERIAGDEVKYVVQDPVYCSRSIVMEKMIVSVESSADSAN